MVDYGGAALHRRAVDQYRNGDYQGAAASFELRLRSKTFHDDELQALSVAADLALCRFRAATNAEFQKEVLYREAIRANEAYLSKVRQRRDLLDAGLLAAISAVWIHTKMDNLRMARHKAWDALQWAVSISSPTETMEICSMDDSFSLISQSVDPLVFRKFRHVFDVLDLVQDFNLSLIVERERSSQLVKTNLASQETAVVMLARRRLSLATDEKVHDIFGIALKLHSMFRAIDEPRDDETVAEELCEVLDHSAPSDLNLLGRFQPDCRQALLSFSKALETVRPEDVNLYREISFNLADCFVRLGEYGRAKDLFLWLQGQNQDSTVANTISIVSANSATSTEVLWMAFVSATLDDDPVATLAVSHLLNQEGRSQATRLALDFSLHQAGRPSLATRCSSRDCDLSWTVYGEAQSLLQDSQLGDGAAHGVISACFYNNRGLALVREGRVDEAIDSFERSCSALSGVGHRYLHPHFNLTLLLWENGQPSRAVDLWASTRNLVTNDGSDIEEQLRSASAKYAAVKLECISNNWIARGIGGLPLRNIRILDCLVLQFHVQEMQAQALENLSWRIFPTDC
ncbi:hypothetical protein MHU86_6143 [Fragilaria crotonensis]|nr:hypothetical protein MHU86_6143 [Fragilaria crotonensis]